MNKRFELKKSEDMPGWWVLTDTENLIVIKFKEHEYNATQRITVIDEERFNTPDAAKMLSTIMQEMGDYMSRCWYSVAMPTPVFEFREDDNNEYMLLIRNKFPKFTIKIHDNCDLKQLSDAMKSCSEFIKRQQK